MLKRLTRSNLIGQSKPRKVTGINLLTQIKGALYITITDVRKINPGHICLHSQSKTRSQPDMRPFPISYQKTSQRAGTPHWIPISS